jgi:hypothetical protein
VAQREARAIFEEDPELRSDDYRLLAQQISMLRNERTDVS